MSTGTLGLDEDLRAYLLEYGVREPDIMRRLREESDRLPMAQMRSSVEQVNALGLLLKSIGARTVIEVGVFTGYATLGFARALPLDGTVHALDISKEWTDIGKKYWDEAGVSDQINLILSPATDTLEAMIKNGDADSADFAFIDADKSGYAAYFEACLTLVRPGGLIAIDNVLWSGRVIDQSDQEESTQAIRAFNKALYKDSRVDLAMLPIGDGLTLAYKK